MTKQAAKINRVKINISPGFMDCLPHVLIYNPVLFDEQDRNPARSDENAVPASQSKPNERIAASHVTAMSAFERFLDVRGLVLLMLTPNLAPERTELM